MGAALTYARLFTLDKAAVLRFAAWRKKRL
jgi:hypothetical protein